MRRFLTCILLLLSLSAAAQTADSVCVDAVALFSNGAYAKAREQFRLLVKATPENDAAWYYLALSEYNSGEPEEAVAHLRHAIALDPGNYWYQRRLAALYQWKGEDDLIIGLYEGILKAFPDKTDISFDLLSLYLKQGRLDDALKALQDIENAIGPSEQTARTRYEIFRHLGRDAEAIDALERYNDEFTSPTILTLMGDYYLSEFRDTLALSCYQEALRWESDYVPARLGVTEVYRTTRRYPEYFQSLEGFIEDEAIPAKAKGMYIDNLLRSIDPAIIKIHRKGYDDVVTRLAERHPADSSILTSSGAYFYSTGRADKALPYFRTAADLYPESISHTATCIQVLGMQEQWEEMRDRSVNAFNRFRELAFLDYANMANYQLKDYDAIIGNSRYIITTRPGKEVETSAWATIGDTYHMKGDLKAAYKAYDKALKLTPDYAPVLNNYAYYLSVEGRKLNKAYKMSKKTIEAEPDNATYLDTFAWILHLQGKDLEAKPFFKHAMLYGGKESPVILDHYAEVLFALGEYDLAKVYWKQALAKNTEGEVPDLRERMEARLQSIDQ